MFLCCIVFVPSRLWNELMIYSVNLNFVQILFLSAGSLSLLVLSIFDLLSILSSLSSSFSLSLFCHHGCCELIHFSWRPRSHKCCGVGWLPALWLWAANATLKRADTPYNLLTACHKALLRQVFEDEIQVKRDIIKYNLPDIFSFKPRSFPNRYVQAMCRVVCTILYQLDKRLTAQKSPLKIFLKCMNWQPWIKQTLSIVNVKVVWISN